MTIWLLRKYVNSSLTPNTSNPDTAVVKIRQCKQIKLIFVLNNLFSF